MNTFLTCPADCDATFTLGAIAVDQDCTNYTQKESQVSDLVITPSTALALPLEWGGAPTILVTEREIDNSDVLGEKSKHIVGEGGLAAPEKTVDQYPKNKSRTTKRTYTLTFNIKNMTDDQYEFLRQLQCGWTDFVFWYATVGGRIFGGANGIEPDAIDVDFPLSEGRGDKEVAVLTLTWSADGDPDRGDSPF